jgi:hypothetical protein
MRNARTHALTGRGFGSNEMTFGSFATEISLNAWACCDMRVHGIVVEADKVRLTSGLENFI